MAFGTRESSRHLGVPLKLFKIEGGGVDSVIGPYCFCDGESAITRGLDTFNPWPIKVGDMSQDGTLDKSDIAVTLALGSPLDDIFLAYPPSEVVNLTVFEGHVGDAVTIENYPATWLGRIISASWQGNELELSCVPVSSAIKRPGLRRNYQIGCPHALYGDQCKANKAAATVARTLSTLAGNTITLSAALATPERFRGGLVEWTNADTGQKEIRTIASVATDGMSLTIRGMPRGLPASTTLEVSRGCNRQMSGCNQHGNILNYGGQPFIPLENPLSQKNQFY